MKNFKTAIELVNYLKEINKDIIIYNNNAILRINNEIEFIFNFITNKYQIKNINYKRSTIFDLTKTENHSVVMLLIKLLEKGYSLNCITLEKSWQTGHSPIYLDVFVENPFNNDVFMIEVKEFSEYLKYTNPENESKIKQLLSYAMQEQATRIASFYSYNFEEDIDCFANIFCNELRPQSLNADDFFDRWNKVFDENDYIIQNPVFNIKKTIKSFNNLKKINEKDTKFLYNQFLTILRLNSISDKPTAFMKMINLFLVKLADEITENKEFIVKDINGNFFKLIGMKFQYIEDETPESFMKRLNELYKDGMKRYLKKDVIDYNDDDLSNLLNGGNNEKLFKIFDDLRLKKNVNFSFIEIYDEDTFLENFIVVKDIVRLLENFKFKYETKHQFLGDFFEELLNTSLKQEAGQFFTPYPIVDYILNSLDFKEKIEKEIKKGERDFIPSLIDYACGAGHFLISAMSIIQKIIDDLNEDNLTTEQKKKMKNYKENSFSWADEKKIVGIEKDYRLAKTTKIASFLNGDGDAEIISGDGINKFDCKEYKQTVLFSYNNKNEIFDYLVSNPPYSVDGFMLNFRKNGINKTSNTFSLLLGEINIKDSAIEVYFVERMEQLLKNNGIGAIILPQSILSNDKYEKMRKFIFNNFKILSLLLTADITFSGTTTSPVILFLRKEKMIDINYNILINQSPKYSNPNTSKLREKETKFLGYEFSSNRAKAGIKIIHNSILSNLSEITKNFIINQNTEIPNNLSQFSKIVNLKDITINRKENYCGDIYPKKIIINGSPLSKYCNINEWSVLDFAEIGIPSEYLEIGNLQDQISSKKMKSNRFCKVGDILISSLTPRKNQIVIAKGNFMLSSAIHVLSSFKSNQERNNIFNALTSNTVLEQMNALLDGFKITYAKISEENLYNNIFLNI